MHQPKTIIVLRFSAMGDVAMLASVLKEFALQYPQCKIIMVSRGLFQAFFNDIPQLHYHVFDPKQKHKGFIGLWRLSRELLQYKAMAVADMHDNIRSRVTSFFLRTAGLNVRRIDKGRAEKKALIQAVKTDFKALKPSTERYADVLRALAYPFKLSHRLTKVVKPLPTQALPLFQSERKKIGLAPFAQHIYKMYPLPLLQEVIQAFPDLDFYIFGGGQQEYEQSQMLIEGQPHRYNLINRFNLSEELNIISNLDLMISMDSSGMHMASLMGVPVVSLWGPTHPYAGFLGYGQSIEHCVQVEDAKRPNSIYGNKPYLINGAAGFMQLKPDTVVRTIKKVLYG